MDHVEDPEASSLDEAFEHDHSLPVPTGHVEDEPTRCSFLKRRKRAILAVASVLVVGAVGIGVAMAVKPKGGEAANQAASGPMQSEQEDVVVASDPAEESSAAVDEYDELTYESTDMSADETFNEESFHEEAGEHEETGDGMTFSTVLEEPDEDVALGAYEDPFWDWEEEIMIDEMVEEGDLIYDSGYAQRPSPDFGMFHGEVHETTGEKVPMNSDDFGMILMDYEGPVTDWIVTPDVSRITVTTSSANACSNPNEGLWRMILKTDNYPWETAWEMRNGRGEVVAKGPPEGRNYARSTRYVGQLCLKRGRYTLKLTDSTGDGMCCTYGRGKMTVTVNGQKQAESPEGPFKQLNFNLRVDPSAQGGNPPAPRPTPRPTPRPNPRPTPRPTRRPTTGNPPGINQATQKCIDVITQMDGFGGEFGYHITPINQPNNKILNKPPGSFSSLQSYENSVCVDDGQYRITLQDSFQGLQNDGYYTVKVDGVPVVSGGVFAAPSTEHVLYVGYQPPMTAKEQGWLNAHNSRRLPWLANKGVPNPTPLVWSPKLAEAASQWVDEILPECTISREPGLVEGENVAARNSAGERDEGAETILTRWVDNKQDSGYPNNQSATQVFWLATRFVGCSEKVLVRADGSRCYVSICRYSRPGNCAMGQYSDWVTPTIAERSSCGQACPDNVCY